MINIMEHYKFIILIIDSDTDPIYASFREIIRKYMNTYPKDIKSFFIRKSAHVSSPTIEGDTIYTHGVESFYPGILEKTFDSMEYCLDKFSFDYIIRTNMSSFWNYHTLLEKYTSFPNHNFVCAAIGIYDNIPFPSGCGFIMSRDVVVNCINNSHMIDFNRFFDDVMIGHLLQKLAIHITPGDRYDFTSSNTHITNHDITMSNPLSHYHYRVKGNQKDGDVHVHQMLYDAIYTPKA